MLKHTSFKLAALVLLGAVSAFPQAKPAADIDSFRLSMPKINAMISAYSGFIELLGSDPALAAQFKQVKKTLPDTNGRDTMGLTAGKMADSRVSAVFAKAGISPKETTMTMECLLGVIMGDGMLEATKTAPKNLPPFVAENLAFYRANKAEVQAAFKRLQSVSPKAAAAIREADEDDEEKNDDKPEDEETEDEKEK